MARAKTTLRPLQERIKSCTTFVERARQRVARAEAVIARAMEQKEIHVKEVSDGESRLQTLMSEEAPVPVPVPPDVQELQRPIDELRRERDLWRAAQTKIHREPQGTWCADGPPSVKEIPPMPTDHQDLQGWVSDRNCDLRNALEFSDHATIAKVGSLLSQGTAQLASGSWDVPMDGSTRSALMASLIEESDAKRRAVQGTSNALPSMVENQV